MTSIVFVSPTMYDNGYRLSLKYLLLCSTDEESEKCFGTSINVNKDDRIFHFGWTMPFLSDGN